uniref:Phosphoethanolamine N-methyltransferase n=1 Tax=Panagrolaimus sp. ES5 TaxID=591445 RepID=A0AC34FFB4_9BILA
MALAREIISSFQSNPSAKKVKTAFLATEDDLMDKAFQEAFGPEVEVTHGGPLSLNTKKEEYDAIILCNVLDDWNLIKRRHHLGDLLKNVLTALKKSGTLVIREDMSRHSITTIPDLTKFFDVFVAKDSDGNGLTFDFYTTKQVEDSLYSKQNHLDLYWILTRANEITTYEEKLATFRDFLDKTQYTEDNVRSYEWIFGENFISPGGLEENRKFLQRYGTLKPGGKMLDIGVGIGGGARQAAKEFGLHVLGVDLSTNMIVHAFERNQRDQDCRVKYQISDILVYDFPENEFDYVFSRDAIHHIPDQDELFAKIYKLLKPGGQIVISRYSKGYGKLQPKFLDYVARRHYNLHNLEEFEGFAKKAGFVNIKMENITPRFKEILLDEQKYTIKNKNDFVGRFSEELYEHHLEGWEDKLGYIADDNHNWHLIYAEKPKSK